MTEPFSRKFSKALNPAATDLLIRAQVAAAEGEGFVTVSFLRARIDCLVGIDTELSGIILRNGTKIAVKMELETLERAIHRADLHTAPVLDLRDATGAAAAQTSLPMLAQDFAAAAPKPAGKLEDVPLVIAFFARQQYEQNFRMCILAEDAIDWSSIEGYTEGKNGSCTRLLLARGTGPFGSEVILFDMPRVKFMELYNLAKMNGDKELDLRDQTRRRAPTDAPPPPG